LLREARGEQEPHPSFKAVAKAEVAYQGRVYPKTPYPRKRRRIAAMLGVPACALEECFPQAAQVYEEAQQQVLARRRRWAEEERREEKYRRDRE
jgi:hypothetical protein